MNSYFPLLGLFMFAATAFGLVKLVDWNRAVRLREEAEVRELQTQVAAVHVNESLVDYLMSIVQTTRSHPELMLGVSTRGALTYFKASQALAMASGREFVIPEDIKRLAAPVLSHRILMKDRRLLRGDVTPEERFIQRIVSEIPVPR